MAVTENSRLCGLIFDVIYDESAYEVVEVISFNEFDEEVINPSYMDSKVRFVGSSTNNISDDATKLFIVKFKVLDTCNSLSAYIREAFIYNENNEDVDVTTAEIQPEIITIHESGDENVILAPTCEEKGFKTYNCPCGEFVEEITPATGHKYKNRVCTVCGVSAPEDLVTITIQEPSRSTIRCKDGIILHAIVDGDSTGGNVVWTANNDNFKIEQSGSDLKIISKDNGYTTFTASFYDESGKYIASHSIEMNSKAGFFDKIGGFFRVLFGTDVIYNY